MLWYPFIAQNSKAVKRGFPVSCRLSPIQPDVLPSRMEIHQKNYGEPALKRILLAQTMTVKIV